MKTSTLNTITKTGALAALAIALAFSFTASKVALADDSGGFGDLGMGSGYTDSFYSTFNPSYDTSSYSPSYDMSSYTPSYSSGYGSSYSPSSGGGYSYMPGSTGGYSYVPSSAGGSSAPQMQYVYSSNTNRNANTNTNKTSSTATNTNTITNNPVNVFNPTNNNDARINLVVLGGSGTNNVPVVQNNLEASCVINPSTAYVGQSVSFYATATGGNGSYTYYWTGDNGLSASGQSFTGSFQYAGYKTATVTVSSNGQTITRSCNVNVTGQAYNIQPSNVTLIQQPVPTANPVSGVFLSQVPATGISFGLKMTLFSLGILMWSAFLAFILNEKRKKSLALATVSAGSTPDGSSLKSRIDAFKLRNMARKGLVK